MMNDNEREAKVVLTADNKKYNKSIEESQKATEKLNKALEKTSETAEKITKKTAKGLLKIGATEIAGLTALSAVAATLEKQTSAIQSNLALNKTASQYNAVTKSIRDMSRTMPMARAEIAAMATSVSDLGMISAKQIGGVTETFTKMGIATNESPVGLASSMVQFQRAMGKNPTNETMTPYANSTTLLSAKAGAPAQDILSFAGSVAPAANVAGLSQSSVLGLSTAATRAGVDGIYGSSTIQQILNDITKLRYTNSPQLGRYATALGMPSEELTRKTTGPEDQDKLMRNIISKIVTAASSEEGPSRLGMLGYEGLRAKKALQGLAAEPGGIEKWINTAEYGMSQPAIETGFEKSTSGLSDQGAMLRNRATDVGQQVGAPLMEAFANVAKGANAVAKTLQPLTDIITSITGKLGVPLATLTMGAGALLAAWGTLSKLSLISKGAWNVGTKSVVSGARDDRIIAAAGGAANVSDSELSDTAQRINGAINPKTGKPYHVTGVTRMGYRIGGALGSAVPADMQGAGIKQGALGGIDRATTWIGRGAKDWYEKAGIADPEERREYRKAQEKAVQKYREDTKAYTERRAAAIRLGKERGLTEEQVVSDKNFPKAPVIPLDPRTKTPLVYDRPEQTLRFRDVLGRAGREYAGTAGAAGKFGLKGAWGATRYGFDRAVVQPIQGIREQGVGSWAGQKLSGVGSGVGSAVQNPMVQMMAATAAIGWAANARGNYGEWKDKWDPTTGGISDAELDNLSEYNDKLGLATRSLMHFTKGLDEANPARSSDVALELANTANVRDYGRSMEELVNKRIGVIETADQAKEWIASQGTMNADQWVLVMRDFSKLFKDNAAAFSELNTWVQENQQDGRVPIETLPGNQELTNRYMQFAGDSNSPNMVEGMLGTDFSGFNTRTFGMDFGGDSDTMLNRIKGIFTGGDPAGLRNNEDVKAAYELKVGSQAARAATIGETKDASEIFGGDGRPTLDQQDALVKAEGIASVVDTIQSMAEAIRSDPEADPLGRKTGNQRILMDQYIKAAGSTFGLDMSDLDAKQLSKLMNSNEDTTRELSGWVKTQVTENAKYDEKYKTILDSGLLDTIASGASLFETLPDLTVLTTSQQAMKGTAFENAPDRIFEKYLGEGSLLGQGFLAAGKLSDPTDFANASAQLLEFAERIDADERTSNIDAFKRGDTTAAWEMARQPDTEFDRQYMMLEQIKANSQEGTQGFEIAKASQAELMRRRTHETAQMNPLEYQSAQLASTRALLGGLNQDRSKQSPDLQRQISEKRSSADEFQMTFEDSVLKWGKSREREETDWIISSQRNWDDYYRQRGYGQEDFQRSMARSQASYNRQMANSEASYQRSLKYQTKDFYRSRKREAESHARQMRYLAEDTAKSIGDPYNRLQLQLLNDPASMQVTMQNRVDIASRQNRNLDDLRGRGLSDEAVQQLDLANFTNAQQTSYFANTATDSDIAEFNKIAKEMIKQGGQLSKNDPNTMRAEKERGIGLDQQLEDFLRAMRRTKFEHVIQVEFNKKEFNISAKNAEEDHKISLARSAEAQTRIMDQAAADRERTLERQIEDLFGFGQKGLGKLEKINKKVFGYIDEYAGGFKSEMKGAYDFSVDIIDEIDTALKKLRKLQKKTENWTEIQDNYDQSRRESSSPPRRSGGGTFEGRGSSAGGGGRAASVSRALNTTNNEYGMCLNQVSKWIGNAPRGVPNALTAWSISKKKHRGDRNPPPGYPVYWGGGPDGHVALSVGGGRVRSTDWPKARRTGTVGISTLTKAWGKPYYGWTEDAWGGRKLAQGGIAQAKPGGVKATIAEAGSNEMVLPLNRQGIDFMSTFTKGVAREMVRSMPKTPVANTVNSYDHSTNVSIETVELASNDPKKFVRELQQEASKKRAALYKGPLSGVSA